MKRTGPNGLVEALALAVFLGLCGCDGGAPSVSSTNAEGNVHGTVKLKGVLVPGGEIRFDPSNIQRRDAKQAISPIGKDGTYKVTTLQGGNNVYVTLPPDLLKSNPALAGFMQEYSVPSGDSTFDIEMSP